jgi:hypothetical protein
MTKFEPLINPKSGDTCKTFDNGSSLKIFVVKIVEIRGDEAIVQFNEHCQGRRKLLELYKAN